MGTVRPKRVGSSASVMPTRSGRVRRIVVTMEASASRFAGSSAIAPSIPATPVRTVSMTLATSCAMVAHSRS